MCGICGKYFYDQPQIVDERVIRAMMNVMGHRGPDDQGSYVDSRLGLGHVRLSIMDLSPLGHQPMSNEDGSVWVVFNGEIYNFLELRSRLTALGHVFRSDCDTEVIVHAYEEYGIDCPVHFNGMFAFAIWDSRKQTVMLARDRAGIKPLYYCLCNDGSIVWGSEIKAILQDPSVVREVDPQALSNFLILHYVPAPRTMFKNINKLIPGHVLVCRQNGTITKQYWELTIAENDRYSEQEFCDRVYKGLEDSVRKRLQSDVAVGALLSGGLDSSAILGLMTKLGGSPVKSFTVGYDRFSEFNYSRKAAKFFGSDYHEVIVDWKKFLEFLPKAVWFEDEPIGEDSAVPMHYVSKLAKDNGVTVLLTGEGSDEIFAGYNRHWGEKLAAYYLKIPAFLRNPVMGRLLKIVPRLPLLKKGHRSMTKPDFWERFLSWHTVFSDDMYREMMKNWDGNLVGIMSDVFQKYEKAVECLDELNKILYVDYHVWLPDDLLMKKDKMGMSVAIEARVPFLDYEFVEFVFSIPVDLKVRGFTTKYILKKSMEELLPKEIIYRKKEGFPTPVSAWLRAELRDFVHDTLLGDQSFSRSVFNSKVIEKLLKEHASGLQDHGRLLFPLLNLELWHKAFFVNREGM